MAASSHAIIRRLIASSEQHQEPLTALFDEYLIVREQPGARRLQRHVISMQKRKRPGGRISPSSVGGCRRESVLKFIGMPGKVRFDPDLQVIFEDGDWHHHKWQALFKDMQCVLGAEVFKVIDIERAVQWDDMYVAGSLDVTVKIRGKLWVIDIKSMNSFAFRKATLDRAEPIEYHVSQLLMYMKSRNVRRGILWYQDKDKGHTKAFVVKFSSDRWVIAQQWIQDVVDNLKAKKLPPIDPECNKGNYAWDKCRYAEFCFQAKSTKQLEKIAYSKFTDIDTAWAAGFAELEEE